MAAPSDAMERNTPGGTEAQTRPNSRKKWTDVCKHEEKEPLPTTTLVRRLAGRVAFGSERFRLSRQLQRRLRDFVKHDAQFNEHLEVILQNLLRTMGWPLKAEPAQPSVLLSFLLDVSFEVMIVACEALQDGRLSLKDPKDGDEGDAAPWDEEDYRVRFERLHQQFMECKGSWLAEISQLRDLKRAVKCGGVGKQALMMEACRQALDVFHFLPESAIPEEHRPYFVQAVQECLKMSIDGSGAGCVVCSTLQAQLQEQSQRLEELEARARAEQEELERLRDLEDRSEPAQNRGMASQALRDARLGLKRLRAALQFLGASDEEVQQLEADSSEEKRAAILKRLLKPSTPRPTVSEADLKARIKEAVDAAEANRLAEEQKAAEAQAAHATRSEETRLQGKLRQEIEALQAKLYASEEVVKRVLEDRDAARAERDAARAAEVKAKEAVRRAAEAKSESAASAAAAAAAAETAMASATAAASAAAKKSAAEAGEALKNEELKATIKNLKDSMERERQHFIEKEKLSAEQMAEMESERQKLRGEVDVLKLKLEQALKALKSSKDGPSNSQDADVDEGASAEELQGLEALAEMEVTSKPREKVYVRLWKDVAHREIRLAEKVLRYKTADLQRTTVITSPSRSLKDGLLVLMDEAASNQGSRRSLPAYERTGLSASLSEGTLSDPPLRGTAPCCRTSSSIWGRSESPAATAEPALATGFPSDAAALERILLTATAVADAAQAALKGMAGSEECEVALKSMAGSEDCEVALKSMTGSEDCEAPGNILPKHQEALEELGALFQANRPQNSDSEVSFWELHGEDFEASLADGNVVQLSHLLVGSLRRVGVPGGPEEKKSAELTGTLRDTPQTLSSTNTNVTINPATAFEDGFTADAGRRRARPLRTTRSDFAASLTPSAEGGTGAPEAKRPPSSRLLPELAKRSSPLVSSQESLSSSNDSRAVMGYWSTSGCSRPATQSAEHLYRQRAKESKLAGAL